MRLNDLRESFGKWSVERVELAFFHACDNRWELYQNTSGNTHDLPNHPETYFKIQISDLLKAIWDAISAIVPLNISVRCQLEAEPNTKRSVDVSFGPIFPREESIRKGFRYFCERQLAHDMESIPSEVVTILRSLEGGAECRVEIDDLTRIQLVGALPIARCWDVFGQLQPMATASTCLEPDEMWRVMFSYRVTQRAHDRDELEISRKLSDIIPERKFSLQVYGGESGQDVVGKCEARDKFYFSSDHLKNRLSREEMLKLVDADLPYYAVCRPNNRRTGPVDEWQGMIEEEKVLYRLYGQLLDALEAQCGPKSGPVSAYYLVIPVIACGYNHFIQIVVNHVENPGDFISSVFYCFLSRQVRDAIRQLDKLSQSDQDCGAEKLLDEKARISREWQDGDGPAIWRDFCAAVRQSQMIADDCLNAAPIDECLASLRGLIISAIDSLQFDASQPSQKVLWQCGLGEILPESQLCPPELWKPCETAKLVDDNLTTAVGCALLKALYTDFSRGLRERARFASRHYMLKESLRELLVQIRISAFQFYVDRWIVDHAKEITSSSNPYDAVDDCFCTLAPHLNEMRAAYTEQYVWYYLDDEFYKELPKEPDLCANGLSEQAQTLHLIGRLLERWAKVDSRNVWWDERADQLKPCVSQYERPLRDVIMAGRETHPGTLPGIEKWVPCELGNGRLRICLYHADVDKFNQVCFSQTNHMRLREQYDWLRHKICQFWIIWNKGKNLPVENRSTPLTNGRTSA